MKVLVFYQIFLKLSFFTNLKFFKLCKFLQKFNLFIFDFKISAF